jgi:ACT domain-containing protein
MSNGNNIVITVLSYDRAFFATPDNCTLVLSSEISAKLKNPQRVYLVGALNNVLLEFGGELLYLDQTEDEGCFGIILWAKLDKPVNMDSLRRRLMQKGTELGASVRMQREDLFNFMHRL